MTDMKPGYEQYGRIEEPGREKRRREAKEKEMNEEKVEKEEEKEPRGFFTRFNNELVVVKLNSGDVLEGRLITNAYNRYDTILSCNEGDFLIPKHSIVYVREKEK